MMETWRQYTPKPLGPNRPGSRLTTLVASGTGRRPPITFPVAETPPRYIFNIIRGNYSAPFNLPRGSHSLYLRSYPRQLLGTFRSSPREPPGIFLPYLSQASRRHTHPLGPCYLPSHSHKHVLVSHIVLSRFGSYMPPSMWAVRLRGTTWPPRQDATARLVVQSPLHPCSLPERAGSPSGRYEARVAVASHHLRAVSCIVFTARKIDDQNLQLTDVPS